MLVSQCLDYYNFIVEFFLKIRNMSHPTLFFSRLFRKFWIPYISIRTSESISAKKLIGIMKRIMLNLKINLKSVVFLTVLSILMPEHGMSFYLFRFSLTSSNYILQFSEYTFCMPFVKIILKYFIF